MYLLRRKQRRIRSQAGGGGKAREEVTVARLVHRGRAAAKVEARRWNHCFTTRNDPGRGPGCTTHPGPTVAVHPSPFSVVASTTTGAGSEMVWPSAATSAPF